MEDTIAAIATALGEGGIGIVRISGENAFTIANKIFIPANPKDVLNLPGYTAHYGNVVNNKIVIDEALLLVMRNPYSFTGENVAEIHCHGGIVAVRKVLQAALEAGARIAEPGEFTKRAFLNGRIDLSQAEAVIEVIRAKTDKAMSLAVNRLGGKLRNKVTEARNKVLAIIAHIEALIDFPEDDVEELSFENLAKMTEEALNYIHELKQETGQGKIYQDGISVAIIGKPNVGKSSLLNALIGENKAIVTHIPGTTRDIVEEWINIEGIPVKIIDTAGIREALDIVEKIGVEKSLKVMQEADIILFVVDVEMGITAADIETLNNLHKERVIVLINKVDLSKEKAKALADKINNYEVLSISAQEDIGLKELAKKLKVTMTGSNFDLTEETAIGNVRHLHALELSEKHLMETIKGIEAQFGYDFLAIDLRAAWEALGEITGDTIGEDIIDQIFTNFCIGK